jgi:hypothetical protein
MPRGDGTGPMGYGQMTGRQLGYCAGYAAPGYVQGGFGQGLGLGRGRGRAFGGGRGMAFRYGGWGPAPAPVYPVAPPVPPANEAVQLKAQIDNLEKTLSALKQRLESMGEESEG